MKLIVVMALIPLLTGCPYRGYSVRTIDMGEDEPSEISEYKRSGRAVARAANDVLPEMNDINSCPRKSMKRVNHQAGGSADSMIRTTGAGTWFMHNAESGQSHNCSSTGE
ncbi:MAG: hypothetical protein H6782_04590 [Candidatus Nomurabacteria bacterium]|nr:MAG: hypothetical protein H6782_04590 [Candidatus Nomurabacteria bacterium]